MKNENDYQDTVTNHLAEAQLGRFDSHRSYSIAIYALEEGIELEIDNNNADKANKLLKFYASLVNTLPQDLANQAREFLADYNIVVPSHAPSSSPSSAPTSMPTFAPTTDEQEEAAPSFYEQLTQGLQNSGTTILTGLAIFALNHANHVGHDGENCG